MPHCQAPDVSYNVKNGGVELYVQGEVGVAVIVVQWPMRACLLQLHRIVRTIAVWRIVVCIPRIVLCPVINNRDERFAEPIVDLLLHVHGVQEFMQ